MSFTLSDVTLADGRKVNVAIDGDRITSVGTEKHGEIIDCSGLVLLPGFVDLWKKKIKPTIVIYGSRVVL